MAWTPGENPPATGSWPVTREPNPNTRTLLVAKPGQGMLVNGKTGRDEELAHQPEVRRSSRPISSFLFPRVRTRASNSRASTRSRSPTASASPSRRPVTAAGSIPGPRCSPNTITSTREPPRVNAAGPPGEWQTLDVTFRAPRFGRDGKKSRKRAIREGGLQRPGDPRERRGQDTDRPCLAAARKSPRADSAPGRSRPGGVSQYPGQPSMLDTGPR